MRFLGIAFFVLCVLVGVVYFSPSYELGRESKKELERGNFQEAYTLAMQALKEDPYNRLAYSIENQSKQRLNIQKFLEDSKKNQESAFEVLRNGSLTAEEFLRLGWMVEEFQRGYRSLLILNQPNAQEKEQLEKYQQWFDVLKGRLGEVKQAKNAK